MARKRTARSWPVQDALEQAAGPKLKDLLLAESPRAEIPVLPRRGWRRRAPASFEEPECPFRNP